MSRGAHSIPVAVAICGEPPVGRALALLLRNSYYDTRFLTAALLSEPGALEGVRLLVLVLTPGFRASNREAFLESLWERAVTAGIPVLELIALSEGTGDRETSVGSGRLVPWPCSTEKLQRHIEEALRSAEAEADGADGRGC